MTTFRHMENTRTARAALTDYVVELVADERIIAKGATEADARSRATFLTGKAAGATRAMTADEVAVYVESGILPRVR